MTKRMFHALPLLGLVTAAAVPAMAVPVDVGVSAGGRAEGGAAGRQDAADPPVDKAALAEARAKALAEMKAVGIGDPGNDLRALNTLAYKALAKGDVQQALKLFRWNLALFGMFAKINRADLIDSLADGFVIAGDMKNAIASYEAALKLTPNIPSDPDAASKLARLKADPKNLEVLQDELKTAISRGIGGQ